MQELENVEIICYDSKVYVPQSLSRRVIDWYHFFLNRPVVSRLAKTIRGVFYWKGLVTQAELFAKTCKICQQFKKRKTIYGHLPPKNISEIKLWDTVHVDLIGPYSKSIRQQQPGGTVIRNNSILTCTTMIDLDTSWSEIVDIPRFDLDEITLGNDLYIDKSSARVSQMSNNTWICIYLRPHKFVFDNVSNFKQDFIPLLKDFNIKTCLNFGSEPSS